jgi:hypothetical protein
MNKPRDMDFAALAVRFVRAASRYGWTADPQNVAVERVLPCMPICILVRCSLPQWPFGAPSIIARSTVLFSGYSHDCEM